MSDGYDPDLQLTNPLVSVADNARQQSRQTFNYNGSFTWEFIDNLKFKTEFGLDHYYNKDKRFYGVTTYNSRINGNNQPIAVFTSKERKTFRNTNTLNYDFKKILKNKDHSLSLLVGQELIKVKSNTDTDEVRFIQNYLRQTKLSTYQVKAQLSQLTNSIMLTISCYPILHVQTMISR